MYFIHNEGNSVVTERFIRTFKVQTHKKMTTNDIKSYLI